MAETKKERVLQALKAFCAEHQVEFVADEYEPLTIVFDVPREVDLDDNGIAKEWPLFKFEAANSDGVKVEER